jgi:hypothetical protein
VLGKKERFFVEREDEEEEEGEDWLSVAKEETVEQSEKEKREIFE